MSSQVQPPSKRVSSPVAVFTSARPELLQRKCACGGQAGLSGECADCRQKRLAGEQHPLVQTKLTVNQPGDRYEQEADRIADQVMRMPAPAVQRKEVLEEEEEETEFLQPKRTDAQVQTVTSSVEAAVQNLRQGGGKSLDPATRAFMEPRFGHDFSQVRVHTGWQATAAARAVNARAFTVGPDVVFGAGQYAPRTTDGQRLLAHELAHTVQQTAIKRQSAPGLLAQREPQTRKERRTERRQKRREERARRREERKGSPSGDPGPAAPSPSVLRIADPTYDRRNPIGRLLREEPVGLTTPTINGTPLPNDYARAGQMVLSALTPAQTAYSSATRECRFADIAATLSANVIVPTEPSGARWTMNIPGSQVKGFPACHSRESVPVTMIGSPDSKTVFDWIEKNEQEHVDDLTKAGSDHLDTYLAWLLARRATDEDPAKCQESLLAARGDRDMLAARDFLDAWLASVRTRDAGGGHNLKNDIRAKSGCAAIEITSRT